MNVAITSLIPFSKSEHRAKIQLRTLSSWEPFFEKIIHVGLPEAGLIGYPKVSCHETEDYPPTKRLLELASHQHEAQWVAIMDGDIYLTEIFSRLFPKMDKLGLLAATSSRRTYRDDPNENCRDPKDHGIGIFVANPSVWKYAAHFCPDTLRVGHPLWDSWLTGAMSYLVGEKFVDFSKFGCVLHPEHGDRTHPYKVELSSDPFHNLSGMPFTKLLP